ncbi:MAG TPA: 4-alpha-glucanotransferase [Treponema sp.]|nr:4-alpha-glucanotransferase [Treponema sp.]
MSERKSGVLLHITSLPGTPGIGTLGKAAYRFADWLHEAGQTLWQVLPLGPTGYGDSPYASFSTFAGNPLLVDLDMLVERGWAAAGDIVPESYIRSSGKIDFGSVVWWKIPVLYTCAAYFLAHSGEQDRVAYEAFKNDNAAWLDAFADYTSIKKHYDAEAMRKGVEGADSMWNRFWPKELASHDPAAVSAWDAAHVQDIEQIKVIQFFFSVQWQQLKAYVNGLGIRIVGDIPIFVAGDSADVWANRRFFQYDQETLQQKTCAGVPPDYFSATGQLWGNPLYDWDAMRQDGYSWWVDRIRHMLTLVDIVRIDHFRGFEAYWQVPFGAPNAIKGQWVKGPGKDLFDTIKRRLGELPIIAEDLGVITPEVEELRDGCGFPGMKILQFAFNDGEWSEESAAIKDLPHNFATGNLVAYTGTHDNDTTRGFFTSCTETCRENARRYLGLPEGSGADVLTAALVRAAFASVADTCVVPLQDVYAVGTEGRMNMPSTTGTNWSWRMDDALLDAAGARRLRELSLTYGRNAGKREEPPAAS